ncbi:YHYH protein [Zooshikella ganghwensis]|uniref:YHYH protein n=1 Tax=Zooshikella ganghwensis TaxID=202772 RepID=A0A4P9VHF7_9GAMM|nr:YHYH protein [Zooshikella ganghwensis]
MAKNKFCIFTTIAFYFSSYSFNVFAFNQPNFFILHPGYYDNQNFLADITLVPCTLANKINSLCFKLSVKSTPIEDGPYCPKTIHDIGGIYPYDGPTNPGLRVLSRALFEDMEKDGLDIIDNEGNIRIQLIDTRDKPISSEYTYCIEAVKDLRLKLHYFIPALPRFATEPTSMEGASNIVGLSFNGVPINGTPPSVIDGIPNAPSGLPALDPCGGHINEGFYHSHIFPETINQKLIKNNIFEVQCEAIYQKYDSALIGYAMDGFPIYGSADLFGKEPDNLDQCSGHITSTLHYPWGIYHYHAASNDPVNIPRCLKGELAEQVLIVE